MQLKDFNQSEKNEATTEEVERVYDILKRTYREQNSKFMHQLFVSMGPPPPPTGKVVE